MIVEKTNYGLKVTIPETYHNSEFTYRLRMVKILNKDFEDKVIMWDDVESLEMVNKNLQISVPYKKLSTLHPADLADILENLDASSRKQIFESLDEDLAADTLEEIEPEYKGSIIKELSETKAAELLEIKSAI